MIKLKDILNEKSDGAFGDFEADVYGLDDAPAKSPSTASPEALAAAKFFTENLESWYEDLWLVDHDEGVDYNGPMAESISDAFVEGRIVDDLHKGIRGVADFVHYNYSGVEACAETIQDIVNNGKTGSVRVQSYLNSVPGFVKKIDSVFLDREGDKYTRKALKKYQTDVVKFAALLKRVKKNKVAVSEARVSYKHETAMFSAIRRMPVINGWKRDPQPGWWKKTLENGSVCEIICEPWNEDYSKLIPFELSINDYVVDEADKKFSKTFKLSKTDYKVDAEMVVKYISSVLKSKQLDDIVKKYAAMSPYNKVKKNK